MKDKSRLSVDTMKVMLIVRHNCDMDCKFYDKIVKDENLMRRISPSEKYSWNKNIHNDEESSSTSI